MVRFLGSQHHFSVLARPHADLSANTRCFHAYGACVSRACLGVPHTTALRNTIIGTTSTNLPGQRLGAPPLYNRSLRVVPWHNTRPLIPDSVRKGVYRDDSKMREQRHCRDGPGPFGADFFDDGCSTFVLIYFICPAIGDRS